MIDVTSGGQGMSELNMAQTVVLKRRNDRQNCHNLNEMKCASLYRCLAGSTCNLGALSSLSKLSAFLPAQ